jgi:hypothetical protein
MKPEVQDFIMRNGWFDKDQKMTRRAIVYKDEYFAENPDGSLEDALQYVETEIKKAFSDKFAPRERVVQQPSPVEGAGSRTIGGKIDPVSKIKTFIYSDPESKRVAKQFIDGGSMTEVEYFKALLTLPEYSHYNK